MKRGIYRIHSNGYGRDASLKRKEIVKKIERVFGCIMDSYGNWEARS